MPSLGKTGMARANYGFDKRQREAQKKQKKLEKQQRKAQLKAPEGAAAVPGDADAGEPGAGQPPAEQSTTEPRHPPATDG